MKTHFARQAVLVVSCMILCGPALLAQLTTLGNRVLEQGALGVADLPETGDQFGEALAVGDFDGDGFDDLAVGVRGQDVNGQDKAGAVQVFFGSRAGLTADRDQLLTQSTTGIPGSSEPRDLFGIALAALDFDCDGFDDLAIGGSGETIGVGVTSGAVWVIFGSASGLAPFSAIVLDQTGFAGEDGNEVGDTFGASLVGVSNGSTGSPVRTLFVGAPGEDVTFGSASVGGQGAVFGFRNRCDGAGFQADDRLHQDASLIPDHAEKYDSFGSALTRGDFDGDGVDDLVVGTTENLFRESGPDAIPSFTDRGDQAGLVHVFYGSSAGTWDGLNSQLWRQGQGGILGTPGEADHFGSFAVAGGDFDGDGFDDLVAGVPGESEGVLPLGAGAAAVIYGSASRLTGSGDQLWSQAGSLAGDIAGSAEAEDGFGGALAVGDFDGDGAADLIVGVPGEDVGAVADAGAVNVLYGRGGFGVDVPRNQILDQGSSGMPGGAEAADHFGLSLAAGDFNGDGRDDVAIGVPDEDLGNVADAGLVQVLYGSDDGVFGTVAFSTSVVTTVIEDLQTVQLRVRRLGPLNLRVTVDHRLVAGGSATLGSDFDYTPGTLVWSPGDAADRIINVRILEDSQQEVTEILRVELANPNAGTALQAPTRATVQIGDDGIDFLFADGFENGTTNRWAETVTGVNNVQVTTAARLGTSASSFGLQVNLADVAPRNPAFVQAGPAQGFANETHLVGSFFVDPQGLTMGGAPEDSVFQLLAFSATLGATDGDALLAFDLRRDATSWFLIANYRNEAAGGLRFAGGAPLALIGDANGRNLKIDYEWQAGNPGRLTVFRTRFVNGAPDASGRVQLFSVDLAAAAGGVNHVYAGLVAGHRPGTSGTLRLDELTFRR